MPAKSKKSKQRSKIYLFFTQSHKSRIAVFAVAFALIGIATIFVSQAATGDGSIPVYRSINPTTQTHLFTTNKIEAASTPGLNYEGVAFYAWSDGSGGRMPVYRLLANNAHVYTMSEAEKTAIVKNGGKLEGIAWYAYLGSAPGRLPVYRLGGKNGDHMYVTSAGERDAISGPGKNFTTEGIAFYSSNQSVPQNYNVPLGAVDTANCKTIAGWGLDKDLTGNGVPINVYIDGKGYDLGFTSVSRGDINAAYRVSGNHGYIMNVPTNWRDSQAHSYVVYALNIDSFNNVIGTNVELKRGEWACNSAGQDMMPQILEQRAEAERQRQAAIAAAQAKAELDQKIINYAVAVEQAKQNEAANVQNQQITAATISAAANTARSRQMAAAVTIASAVGRNHQNSAQVIRSTVVNAQAQTIANTINHSSTGLAVAMNIRR